ncbi:MAG TPA: D-glycero-beta-D-manno-heptose-7-phosphate kinase [Longimicrobiaceae bacterium]|nr:D-glycero-beta-D-manno-heptose-7-phosphate kinase [Longimicrobiaceae bacterium]
MSGLTAERAAEILAGGSGKRIVVVGDLMLDVYLAGVVSRISPEAPVPVVQVSEERIALGGAANVAANVAALGAHCDLVGYVGSDSAGRQIRSTLAAADGGALTAYLVERDDRPTTTKTRVMARRQQVVRFDREHDHDLADDCTAELCQILRDTIPGAAVLVLEDYNKGVLSPVVICTALELAKSSGVPVAVDPKFRNIFEYQGADIFKPNAFELATALGMPVRAQDDEWLENARKRFGCEHLLVTLGEEGMVLHSADGSTFRVPALAREVFDVSGAGDTVIATVAVAVAAGASVREAAVLANFAAGIEVAKPGVATVRPAEIKAFAAALAAAE